MIVSLDGGCTVIEMIDKVDYDMINKNKKIFWRNETKTWNCTSNAQ